MRQNGLILGKWGITQAVNVPSDDKRPVISRDNYAIDAVAQSC